MFREQFVVLVEGFQQEDFSEMVTLELAIGWLVFLWWQYGEGTPFLC